MIPVCTAVLTQPRKLRFKYDLSFRPACLQVGKAMSSNESAAYTIMRSLDVDYVLIIFGGVIGYSGDDINKFLWMVRIAEGEHPKDIRVSESFLSLQLFSKKCLAALKSMSPLHSTWTHTFPMKMS